MKKLISLVLCFLFVSSAFAQKKFEKGYYITNADERVEVLIQKEYWIDNPTDFYYKTLTTAEAKLMSLADVKEFGLARGIRYQKFRIKVNEMINRESTVKWKKESEFVEKEVFLKVLLVGKASLYLYEKDKAKKYFYAIDEAVPKQLVYTIYQPKKGELKRNKRYQQQLWNNLKCGNWSPKKLSELKYKKSALLAVFKAYNEQCGGEAGIVYKGKTRKKALNISIRPRFTMANFEIENRHGNPTTQYLDLPQQSGVQFALELEYMLPFDDQRISVFAEPVYRAYEQNLSTSVDYEYTIGTTLYQRKGDASITASYETIEVPLGMRYRFIMRDKFQLFITAAYGIDIPMKRTIISEADATQLQKNLEFRPENVTYLGLGGNFLKRFNVEFRYGMRRNLLYGGGPWSTFFQPMEMIFGYRIY